MTFINIQPYHLNGYANLSLERGWPDLGLEIHPLNIVFLFLLFILLFTTFLFTPSSLVSSPLNTNISVLFSLPRISWSQILCLFPCLSTAPPASCPSFPYKLLLTLLLMLCKSIHILFGFPRLALFRLPKSDKDTRIKVNVYHQLSTLTWSLLLIWEIRTCSLSLFVTGSLSLVSWSSSLLLC